MQKIKSFLYLDEYKMYSISSQLFEGITEYSIDYKNSSTEESEGQKGPIGSGKILADILKSEKATTEKKYLHDYSYQKFEEHLIENNQCIEIDTTTIAGLKTEIGNCSFIKIRGKAIFNDINMILSTLNNFNNIGEAITYVTNFETITEAKQQLDLAADLAKNPKEKAKLKQQAGKLLDITKLAKESGLHQDPKFLEKLSFLLTYGFQDQFEVKIPIDKMIFSANLIRGYLKENEQLLVRKYSRMAEKEFVLFGMVTQSSCEPNQPIDSTDENPTSIKEAMMTMITHFTNMESSFTGRLPNEIIIDPIALYREL